MPLTFRARVLIGLLLAVALFTAAVTAAQPQAYVVNSVGESLSRINLATSAVANNILTLGSDVSSAPNQIVIFGDRGYVTNSLTNEIQVIDLNADTTVTFWPLPVGSNPYWMAVYNDSTLFVSLTLFNRIARINLHTGSVMRTDSTGLSPQQLLISDHLLYVANTALNYSNFQYEQGTIAVWDIRGDSLVTIIPVGTNPQQLAVDNSGRIQVICTGNYATRFGIVYVLDPLSRTVIDSLPVGGSPGGLVITPDNRGWLAAGGFATSGELYTYDAGTLTPERTSSNPIPTGLGCSAVEGWKENSVLTVTFANTVELFDSSLSSGPVYHVGSGPSSVAVHYIPGDVDGSWEVDIADLTRLVDFLFISFSPLAAPAWRGDVDGQLGVDIGDLTALVDNLFISFQPLRPGAPWKH